MIPKDTGSGVLLVNGPSRWSLMLAIFDERHACACGYDPCAKGVHFRVAEPTMIPKTADILAKSDSHNSEFDRFRFPKPSDEIVVKLRAVYPVMNDEFLFEGTSAWLYVFGNFDVRTRKGAIWFRKFKDSTNALESHRPIREEDLKD